MPYVERHLPMYLFIVVRQRLLSLGSGTAGSTSELYGTYNCVLGIHEFETLEVEVANSH